MPTTTLRDLILFMLDQLNHVSPVKYNYKKYVKLYLETMNNGKVIIRLLNKSKEKINLK